MKKVLSVIFAFLFIITMLSACKSDEVNIEDCDWKLYSVSNLNKNGTIIATDEKTDVYPDAKVVDIVLIANDGELTLQDKTNSETYNGAYEEMLVTDNADDYKIFLDGKEGYINTSKTSEKPVLIMTIDGYDLYFRVK